MDRTAAEHLDRNDPLAPMRARFQLHDDGPIYLNANSLGALCAAASEGIAEAVEEWGELLVTGWDRWIDLPSEVGDRIGQVIGSAPGQVLACDSTTVNLYKLADAALASRPTRAVIVGDANDFPTDRYILEGLAQARTRELLLLPSDPIQGLALDELDRVIDGETALVCLSHVNYRSGARLDMAAVTETAHRRGALVIWDLSHSAGVLPVQLDESGADMAVGCTYKHLNAGPGAPAYLYVRRGLQEELRQPVWGWFGQEDQFAMGQGYLPQTGIGRFATGTPPVLGLRAVGATVDMVTEAGVGRVWTKSQELVDLLVELISDRLGPLGVHLASPADPARRGAHVSIAVPQARQLCHDLIARRMVVGDFREPNSLRLCPAPLYTRYVDVFDAVERIAEALSS